jgi:hypothetical protein
MNPRSIEQLDDAFRSAGADEGTLWLLDEPKAFLVPVWNSGPDADKIVGQYRQPLTAGLISLTCISQQALCENGVYRNAKQDPTLDRSLGKRTCSMIAVPFCHQGEIRGVVSCVKLTADGPDQADPPGFTPGDLRIVAEAACRAAEQSERECDTDGPSASPFTPPPITP